MASRDEAHVTVGTRRSLGRFTTSGIPVLLAGSVAGQLAVLATTPILSRLFTPSALGLFAVLSAVESILVVAASLRYDHAMAAVADEDEAASLLSACAVLAALSGAAVALLVATAGGTGVFGLPNVRRFAIVLGIAVAVDAGYQAMTLWALRHREFRKVAAAKTMQGVGQAAGQVAFGLAPGGVIGLMMGWVVGRLGGIVTLVRTATGVGIVERLRERRAWRAAAASARFPRIALPAAVLNAVTLQAPGVLLALAFDPRVAGLYFLASRVTGVPMTLVAQALWQAFVGRMSPAASAGRHRDVRRDVVRSLRRLLPVATVPTAAVMVLGPVAFPAAFGPEWHDAGYFACALAPAFLAQILVMPFAWVLTAAGKQQWQLIWDACRLLLASAAIIVPAAMGSSALLAISLYSAVFTVGYALLLVLILKAAPAISEEAGPTVEVRPVTAVGT